MRTIRTRAVSALLVLILLLGLLPGTAWAAEPELEGIGTPDDPYLISNEEELRIFRDLTAGTPSDEGNNPNAALCARLTADLDLSGEEWEPFSPADGYVSSAYAGTFDGDGHTISGLSINSSESNQGLFGLINGAAIQNLNVEGSVSSTNSYVGGIVGKVQSGTIENCSFSGTVTSGHTSGYAGGIAGYAGNSASQKAVIENCSNSGDIAGATAGGIVGYAKYSSLQNCYNVGSIQGKNRSGGIAGQLQNNCGAENCYHIGEVQGSETAGGICDFLYTSSTLVNCYSTGSIFNAGTGSAENCEVITSTDGLAAKLGDAFTTDGEGNIVLVWQAGGQAPDRDPRIQITGAATLYDTNSGPKPQTTLTVAYQDMDDTPRVTWEVVSGGDVVELQRPQNPEDTDHVRIVQAVQPGKAVIRAAAGDCSDEIEITVMPFVTTVEIEGTAAAGQTVRAKVNVLGGGEYDCDLFPELRVQWYVWKEEDYPDYTKLVPLDGETERELVIPENQVGNYLYFRLDYNGEEKAPSRPVQIMGQADGVLAADLAALTLPEEIRADPSPLSLPTEGKHGSSIAWESSDPGVISPAGVVTLPAQGKQTVTLTAALTYGGESRSRIFQILVWSQAAVDEEQKNELQQAADSLGEWYRIDPVFGRDDNVIDILQADLAEHGYSDLSVSISSVTEDYGGAGISEDGDITYFYADPNTAPVVRFGRYQVTFLLEQDGAALLYGPVPVIIGWDADRVRQTMSDEVLRKVTLETILADGDTAHAVTRDLTLPRAVDGKLWTLISWQSSNESVLSIRGGDQGTADTLFAPCVGVVRPGETEQKVTLTAAFQFQLTSDEIGTEAPITLVQTYQVTVPAMTEEDAEAIRAGLLAKLDAGFAAKGLTDASTGARLEADENGVYHAVHDIQLPTTRDFGVDGKYYPVTLSSSDPELITAPDVNNAARFRVYRPGVGRADGAAEITVTLHDRDTEISASRTFSIAVPALTQAEVDAELALMDRVKASYFEGLNNGANAAKDDVRRDLSPFFEAYEGADGQLVWVRDTADMTGHGIVPTPIEGWEELEAWRLFKSSNPAVIAHETLEVTRQAEAKAVTITSYLSSETLGRYGELYQSDPVEYAQYEALSGLYYQPVAAQTAARPDPAPIQAAGAAYTGAARLAEVPAGDVATVLVRGTRDPSSTVPVVETIDVTFSLSGPDGTWIAPVTLSGLDETTAVYDVFREVLSDHGYTYTRERGTYIVSITTPEGETWSEKDRGENSGWLYRVNGTIPDVYMAACGLHDGDYIQVFYTDDYDQEHGYENDDWSRPELPGTEQPEGSGPVSVTWEEESGTYQVSFSQEAEGPQVVTIPEVEGQLVVIVHPDGTEDVIKKSLVADGRAVFVLDTDAAVRVADYANPFSDVARDAWYAESVDFAAGRGLFSGVAADRFAPDQTLSRGMLVTVLHSLEEPDARSGRTEYSDVDAEAWYAPGTAWAAEAGIVAGYPDGRFGPGNSITREQLAVMLYRYAQSLGLSTGGRDTLRSFYDSWMISDWARDAVAWAVDSGILSGRTGGILDPGGLTTRAEAAVMLRQLVALMLA